MFIFVFLSKNATDLSQAGGDNQQMKNSPAILTRRRGVTIISVLPPAAYARWLGGKNLSLSRSHKHGGCSS